MNHVDEPANELGKPGFPNSDVANAYRFAEAYRGELRWAEGVGWLTWSGSKWEPSDLAARAGAANLGRIVLSEVATLHAQAAAAASSDERRALVMQALALRKWARQSESKRRIRAALWLAQPLLEIDAKLLDENLTTKPRTRRTT